MNSIAAINHRSEYAKKSHLVIAVDGVPLDVILSKAYPDRHLIGLVPTVLDWLSDERERRIVWQRILPPPGLSSLAPVLMCPDDSDFYCTIVVAEIITQSALVRWLRVGVDASEAASLPNGIGTAVDWLANIGPYRFKRSDYENCLDQFRALRPKNAIVAT